jgi:hypothetical protein
MVRTTRPKDASAVAQLLTPQAPRPREPDTRSQAAPIVVCPLDSSREGQHAVAVAASFSRGLGGQLALVHGGSTPLEPAEFAAVAVQAEAALIVISTAPAEAQALAVLARCPVVVVPAVSPPLGAFDQGPVVCAVDRTRDSGHVASAATRFALQLGATLRLVHIGRHTSAAEVPAIATVMGATLVVVSADAQKVNLVLAAGMPVMLIPDRT